MQKKFLKFITFIIIIFSCNSLNTFAEEYIFTTNQNFILPRSSSIEIVNSKHNIYTTDNIEDIQHLIDLGIVETYESMSYSELFDYTPRDKYYSDQYNLSQIYTQFAWNRGVFGENIKIAIIDSGLYNAASDFNFSNIFKVADYTETASSKNTFCYDEIGHGTKVAGIIAAAHNTRGIAGIAPNVELYIFKCFYINEKGNSTAKNSNVIDAVYSAIDDYGVDVINFSAGTTNSTIFREAMDYAEEKGVVVVAAAGNQGANSTSIYYPASYDNVIGVGSVDSTGHVASHSQRNNYVDIVAPGVDIYSVSLSGYDYGSGTSFAAPHVVSALALAKSLNPDLTAKELTEIVYSTATKMEDRFSGNGRLNLQHMLTYVKSTVSRGNIVYSTNGSTIYSYLSPPTGYIFYNPTYDNGMLSSIYSIDSTIYYDIESDDYSNYLIWNKNSLSPWNNVITKEEY